MPIPLTPPDKPSLVLGCAVAIAAVVGIILIKVWFSASLGPPVPFLLLFAPGLLGAWYGGRAAGIVGVILAGLGAVYCFLPPFYSFSLGQKASMVQLSAFFLESSIIVLLTAELQRLRQHAAAQAEEAQQARSITDLVLRAVEDGITLQEPSGRLIYANDAAARLSGFSSADSMLKAPLSELRRDFELLDERGAPLPYDDLPGRQALQGIRAERVLRFRVVRTGAEQWSLVKGIPARDQSGKLHLAVNIFRDITKAKGAEDARLREEARRHFVADAMVEMSASLDYEKTLAAVARLAVPRIADWCAVDMLQADGLPRRLAVAHVDPAKVAYAHELERRYPTPPDAPRGVPAVLRTGKTEWAREIPDAVLVAAAQDEEHLRIGRSLGLRSYIMAPMIARGRVLGVLTLVSAESGRLYDERDVALAEVVAERGALALDNALLYREAQAARAAAERETALREELLSIVSHDLRNPLAAIAMSATQLQRRKLGAVADAPLLRVQGSVARMQEMIEQLLNFSRVRLGDGMPINRREERLDRIVHAVADELEAAHPGIRIRWERDREVSGWWDAARLGEALSNLIGNAIQHGGGGEVTVTLADTPEEAIVRIHNGGEPIPASVLPHIFTPFRRGQPDSKDGGLGLGLYIARQIVVAHGGDITVSSDGQGTIFTVRVPRAPAPA